MDPDSRRQDGESSAHPRGEFLPIFNWFASAFICVYLRLNCFFLDHGFHFDSSVESIAFKVNEPVGDYRI